MPKYDFKGINFEKFTQIFGKIYSDVYSRYSKHAQTVPVNGETQTAYLSYPTKDSIMNLGTYDQITDSQSQIKRTSLLSKTPRIDDKFSITKLRLNITENSQPEISHVTIDSLG